MAKMTKMTFNGLKKLLLKGAHGNFKISSNGMLDYFFVIGKTEGIIGKDKEETDILTKEEIEYFLEKYSDYIDEFAKKTMPTS